MVFPTDNCDAFEVLLSFCILVDTVHCYFILYHLWIFHPCTHIDQSVVVHWTESTLNTDVAWERHKLFDEVKADRRHRMYTVALLFLYTLTNIFCNASASCPCHIPCTGKQEVCTCYGPCGDDGYGCKTNGEDHEFHDQIQCRESEWQVKCIRRSQCSAINTVDDTNPFAAYKQAANRMMIDSFDDDMDDSHSSALSSMTWFGGNWFDFWGKNEDQFFNQELLANNDNAESMQSIKANNQMMDDDDDISIDNKDFNLISSASSKRTLQNSQSTNKQFSDYMLS